MMKDVVICECFARDGLQHEPEFLPTETKAALIEQFARAGFERVEATSYSNPAVVPQFGDATELLRRLARHPGVFYKATCANVRAVERALADDEAGFGANEISLLVSATDSHSERNLRRSRQDQWQNIASMAAAAGERFRKIGTVSVAFGCPFEGAVSTASVLQDVERFAALGVKHVTLGDTTGMSTPKTVKALFREAVAAFPDVTFISHFHDTRGTGLLNCLAAFDAGVRYFDSAFGGVGGHPAKVKYGGGHTGNVCTEDLVNLLESEGIRTGIDLSAMMAAGQACEQALGRQLHSRVLQSGLNPLLRAT
ncbi:MAG: hydroxymethylglutaryl-CoA lyase [Noviherbaspirillum sp.]